MTNSKITNKKPKSLKVAVLQMQCDDTGDKKKNMATFERLTEQAVKEGATLVLGPECAICGYTYEFEPLWRSAEPQGGETEQFLQHVAKQHNIYLGCGYLEAREIDGEAHFVNTFVLAGPLGDIVGRVCKATPCSVEAYFFRAPPPMIDSQKTSTPHVITLENGLKLGVLICYENFVYDSLRELQDEGIDLLLQPFSGPLADDAKPHVKEAIREMYLHVCSANAKFLNCPALYCNKVGPWRQPFPSSCMAMILDTEFPGCSSICSPEGKELGRLSETQEDALVCDVRLSSSTTEPGEQKALPEIPRYWGGYTDATPFLKVCLLFEWLGARSYKNDELRKKLAREALQA